MTAKKSQTMTRGKRIMAMGDTHTMHMSGLIHPADDPSRNDKFSKIRAALWRNYKRILKSLEPIDGILFLGDAIAGKGERSGGTEILDMDRIRQATAAAHVINEVRLHGRNKNFKVYGVYGTPYHAGASEDMEDITAKEAGFEHIGGHEWINIDGVVFDIKHACGSSGIPHGRATAIKGERLWNTMWWAENGGQPRADVIIRGHVHYHEYCGRPGELDMTLPALQGFGSKFGARKCRGIVHWGLTHFDVRNGAYDWASHTVNVVEQLPKVMVM